MNGVPFTAVKMYSVVPVSYENEEQLKGKIMHFSGCNIIAVLYPMPLIHLCKYSSYTLNSWLIHLIYRDYLESLRNYSESRMGLLFWEWGTWGHFNTGTYFSGPRPRIQNTWLSVKAVFNLSSVNPSLVHPEMMNIIPHWYTQWKKNQMKVTLTHQNVELFLDTIVALTERLHPNCSSVSGRINPRLQYCSKIYNSFHIAQ